MVTKSTTSKKEAKKPRVKTLNLKRETLKDVSSREQKKIKGGGGCPSGVLGDRAGAGK